MDISHTHTLLDATNTLIKTYLAQVHTQQRDVVDFHPPEELRSLFTGLHIDGQAHDIDALFTEIENVLTYSVATQHTRFFNQLYAAADIWSIVAEWLTAILNTSMYTYEVGPVFTLMEEEVFARIADLVGWGDTVYDGMMLPGGSTCNLYGMQLARYALDPQIHLSGLYQQTPLVIFTSDESHYSITKSAMLMGLGKESIIKVATHSTGEMNVDDLRHQIDLSISQGKRPMMINATSGTTVLGAYDEIGSIADIAQEYNIWLHVDAIWGGGVLFHEKYKNKVSGINRADSFSWNPHKMMGTNLQGSIFMTRRPEMTATCNTLKAQYLFNEDKGYGVGCDTGDKYIQCGRRVDVLKLWLQWKAHGDVGFSQRIATMFANTVRLTELVKQSERLYLVQQPTCTNVCFRYIPTGIDMTTITHDVVKDNYNRIHTLTAKIKDLMMKQGKMMTGYAPVKDLPNFFRMILINPAVTDEDLQFVVDHIQALGKEIEDIS